MRTSILSTPRGSALLEAIIGLSILLVGLLGMLQLQIFGITTNQGARAMMRANQIAKDLAAGLDALPYRDALGNVTPAFTATVSSTTAPPPAPFGYLVSGGTVATAGVHDAAADASLLPPGVIPDAMIERDPTFGGPLYQRRWSVWNYQPAGATVAIPLVAVSVAYREAKITRLREVVVYLPKVSPGDFVRSQVNF